jgi:TonB family protein
MRLFGFFVAALLLGGTPVMAAVEEAAVPIEQTPPVYPAELQSTQGEVTLKYTIDAGGHVKDAAVIEATPPAIFDAAALAAVNSWRYAPKRIDGQPVEQAGNKIRLRFKPIERPMPTLLYPVAPDYPKEAFKAGIEGSVKLRFDVDQYGLAQNIQVLSSLPDSTFDQAATSALKRALFKPLTLDDDPAWTSGMTMVIAFNLQNAHFDPEIVKSPGEMVYPLRAQQLHIEGYCRVRNVINPDGVVTDSKILNAYPADIFDTACLSAAKSIIYASDPNLNGLAAPRAADIQYRFLIEANLPKPGQARIKPAWAKFQYTLKADGSVFDIKLLDKSLDAEPGWVIGATEQLSQTKFRAHSQNGVVLDEQGRTIVIRSPGA